MSAPEPGLFNVSVVQDAQKQATRVYAVGAGSEAGILVRSAGVVSTLPALDTFLKLGQISDVAQLQSHADAYLATHLLPTEQWSLSMLASGGIESMPLGSVLRLWFQNDPWITTGWHTLRLIGFDFDESENVALIVQPVGGV